MPSDKDLPLSRSLSTEILCARILERHPRSVRVLKKKLAVANLAKIVEATLKLSNRQGFHATTLRHLARESGLSMGGLYSYFTSKNGLLKMILEEVDSAAEETLSAPSEEVAADPRRHLRWLIGTHIRLTEAMQPWFVFAYMEAKSFPPAARKIAVDSEVATERFFALALERGVDAGVFAVDNVELTASLIKPLLQDWYIKRGKYRRRGTSIEAYIESVSALVEAFVLKR